MPEATWKPYGGSEAPGRLDAAATNSLPDSVFAFPRARKEPMTDATHVRNAIARFDQVEDVTDAERDLAFANIQAAARYFGIEMTETNWHQLGVHPQPPHRRHRE
jgi:hypothetical protein